VTGDVWVMRNVSGAGLCKRDIYVYLPPGYAQTRRRYPVLYMQDGQNIFDDATAYVGEWGCDEAAEALAQQGWPCIMVGIPNAGEARMSEYNPWPRESKRWGNVAAQGDAYLNFLTRNVKPLIDKSFRTRRSAKDTGIGGSSMGALIALYGALTRPNDFGFCLAMSASIWFSFGKLFELARKARPSKTRFYLDMGQREGQGGMLSDARQLHAILRAREFDVSYIEDARGIHNESSWMRRFPAALAWFLNPKLRPGPAQ
jgi:predicted alpha/beta superfamily hydrolase